MSFYNRRIKTSFDDLKEIEEEVATNEQSFSCKERVTAVINAQFFYVFMVLLTVYSIFAVDVQKVLLNASYSVYFGVAHIVALVIFAVEMLLNTIAKTDYFCGFFFWIDLFSNLSMVLQIGWVDDYLSANTNVPVVFTFAKIIKAGRLTKVGGRVVKMIGLFFELVERRKTNQRIDSELKDDEQPLSEAQSLDQNGDVVARFAPIVPEFYEIPDSSLPFSITRNLHRSESPSDDQLNQPPLKSTQNKRSKVTQLNRRMVNKQPTIITNKFQQSNIVERLQKCIIMPHIVRRNVDPVLQDEIEAKFIQVCDRKKEDEVSKKSKLKVSQQNFKLGEALKQNIQKNTIIMIMSLIMILPILDSSTWISVDPSIQLMVSPFMAQILQKQDSGTQEDPLIEIAVKEKLDNFINFTITMTTPLIYLRMHLNESCCTFPGTNFPSLNAAESVEDLAQAQLLRVNTQKYSLIFSSNGQSRIQSQLNIIRSIYIIVLLVVSSIIFMHSIEKYALEPLEQMCISINNISINPFDALKEAETESPAAGVTLQTKILQKAIIKMTQLLAVGAGELGAKMIMNDDNFGCTELHGIFLHLRIPPGRELPALNRVSKIVVETCIMYGAMPVENYGESHLLFWRTDGPSLLVQSNKSFSFLKEQKKAVNVFGLVLHALLEIHIGVWAEEGGAGEEEGEEALVRAGMHYGSCLEGVLGSAYKLETKLIGEEVQLAARLSRLSQLYRVGAVVSEQFFMLLPENENHRLRKIDCVGYRGQQCFLYAYDFEVGRQAKPRKRHKITEQQVYARRKEIVQRVKTMDIHKALPENKLHSDMTRAYTLDFYESWAEAVDFFFNERFDEAAAVLESIRQMHPQDGPTLLLLQRIRTLKLLLPHNWEQHFQIDLY